MKVEVRRARKADVPGMAKVVCDWERSTDWMISPYSDIEIEEFIEAAFDARDIWVIGDPVNAYLSFDPNTLRVGGLYCRATGVGFGKALMDKVKADQNYVWLTTHAPNTRAQAFYKREGFVEVERHDAEPPNTIQEVKMEWRA